MVHILYTNIFSKTTNWEHVDKFITKIIIWFNMLHQLYQLNPFFFPIITQFLIILMSFSSKNIGIVFKVVCIRYILYVRHYIVFYL